MKKIFISLAFFLVPSFSFSDLSKGEAAFQARKWSESMDAFLDVLKEDPGNAEAHAYVTLIAREEEAERQSVVREHRLEMLSDAVKRAETERRDPEFLAQALTDTSQAENRAQEEKWGSRCAEARMERQAGHFLSAFDILLQILSENSAFAEAQRELSDLQSRARALLDSGTTTSVLERYALEGFYAYGQADYAAALVAWDKVRTILEQSYPGRGGEQRLAGFHFLAYEAVARNHVGETMRVAGLRALFEGGVALYQQKHFAHALEEFRKLAIRDPEYPQLGYYLVQAEAGAENERAKRLGERKRREIERALQEGLAALDQEKFSEAQSRFESVLRLDPSHPAARSYLAMAKAETLKRHDPKAAQMHYEAGLIAYAGGKLDEAEREWRITTRMDPRHEKAFNALAKVRKELALGGGREALDEALP